jgi:hypothetical protein
MFDSFGAVCACCVSHALPEIEEVGGGSNTNYVALIALKLERSSGGFTFKYLLF